LRGFGLGLTHLLRQQAVSAASGEERAEAESGELME